MISLPVIMYMDMDARVSFLGFYIPHNSDTEGLCKYLSDEYINIMNTMLSAPAASGGRAGQIGMTRSNDLIFSRRIYIYSRR